MSVPIESAFQFCPRCGEANQSPASIPFRCAACGMTLFFGPVAAVGGLIVNEKGELLLVRRARNPGKGRWGLPGGFVDRGETIEQALQREVIEETQLRLVEQILLVTFPNSYDYHGVVSPVIDLFYLCRIDNDAEIKLARDELDHFVWTIPTAGHLDNMAFESNRRAIEYWLGDETPDMSRTQR
ncbi:NUDIX hydrolase [Stieleria varia]|uniref:GDP-mannose mannosyl hydrolase n=1 Tax=Stieleria varia TaxID=2528005 RepID=A0A5C6AHX6_9BACT|nr:NUDIX domain-containing protein [Stieleria varia]TWT98651.1 GDP-mannose mannosyl hydrolase [Stieleria varia]